MEVHPITCSGRLTPLRRGVCPQSTRVAALVLLGVLLLHHPKDASAQAQADQQHITTQHPSILDAPRSPRLVSYNLTAELLPGSKAVQGTARISWRNPDRVPVDELQFHLYLNAFRDTMTTFMRESGGAHRGNSYDSKKAGHITLQSMDILRQGTQVGREDILPRLRFMQPDDGNPHDETVAAVTLPRPVAPGETIELEIDFYSKLPKVSARTGWEITGRGEPFYLVAQWFPKLGVYEVPGQRYVPEDAPSGKWSTHQFHANSEFYADFGVYHLRITAPSTYTVGASGRLQETTAASDTTLTHYYIAEDVHDVAWTASPDFAVFEDQWRHVAIRLLLLNNHADQAQRHLEATKAALEQFDAWVGPYPYTTLTVVDGVGGANGMEYPTFITAGTAYKMPSWLRAPELVTIHEFGHQYFYGLLASNEAEEAWLDEGLNSYLETHVMDSTYGRGSVLDIPGLELSDTHLQIFSYVAGTPDRGPLFRKAWEYDTEQDYGVSSYAKPATVMHSLAGYVGWETMVEILRTYYDRWAFRHPTTRDFQDVVEDVADEDMDWFFDQYVYGEVTVDYEVYSVSSERKWRADSTMQYQYDLQLHRVGSGYFPVDIEITFADGTTSTVAWDGQSVWKFHTLTSSQPITQVWIDPSRSIALELTPLDNRWTSAANEAWPREVMLIVQYWVSAFVWLFGLFA